MSNNSSKKTEFVKLKKLTFINHLIEDKIKLLSDDINNSELKKNQEQLSPDLQKDLNKIFKLFISELSDIRTKIKESNACIEKDFGIKISPKERKKSQIIFENEFVNYISKKKEYFVSLQKEKSHKYYGISN